MSLQNGARMSSTGNRIFWLLSMALTCWWTWLAFHTCNFGFPDSRENVHTAVNILRGSGYVSNIVQQLAIVVSLPHPETFRQPMLPYLLAAAYRLTGIGAHTQVILNAMFVLCAAVSLRAAVVALGAPRLANVAGVLFLLGHNYWMINAANNNLLTLISTLFLLTAAKWQNGRFDKLKPWMLPATLGVLTACAFYTKQSFVLSSVPFSIILILRQRSSCKSLRSAFVIYAAAATVLSAPYVLRDLYFFHCPVYTDSYATCLAQRYPAAAFGGCHGYYRTVRFNKPITMSEVIAAIGWRDFVRTNYVQIENTLTSCLSLEPAIFFLLAVSFCLTRRHWADALLPLLLCIEPLVICGVLWHVEPRYLWPIYPVEIYWIASNLQSSYLSSSLVRRDLRLRFKLACLVLSAFAVGAGLINMRNCERVEYMEATKPKPAWVAVVSNRLPTAAIVLSEDPWSVTCYTGRPSVMAPLGTGDELKKVLRTYKPEFYLWTARNNTLPEDAGFERKDLVQVDVGRDWALYKLARQEQCKQL